MHTLSLIKGRALVISGAPGSGKSVLARELAETHGRYVCADADVIFGRFKEFLNCEPAVLILEGVRPTWRTLDKIRELLASTDMSIDLLGRNAKTIKTPQIILVLANEVDPGDTEIFQAAPFSLYRMPTTATDCAQSASDRDAVTIPAQVGIVSDWRSPTELPEVPAAEFLELFVTVEFKGGKRATRTAVYANAWPADCLEGDESWKGVQVVDVGATTITGWLSASGFQVRYDMIEPLLDADVELIAWQPFPAPCMSAEDLAAPLPPIDAGGDEPAAETATLVDAMPRELFDPQRLPARDADGYVSHPDFERVVTTEDECDITPFFTAAGLEIRGITEEFPEGTDGDRVHWFSPAPPSGGDWRLVYINTNEDGEAVAVYCRPLAQPQQPAAEVDTLGAALPREIERVRNEVMPTYSEIGLAGAPALLLMRAELDRAEKATAAGDVVGMLQAYEALKGYAA